MKIIEFIRGNILTIILLFSTIGMGSLVRCNDKSYRDSLIIKNDSIRTLKNRAGELYTQNESYVITINDLKKINRDLYDETKKLRERPVVVSSAKAKVVVKDTTIYVPVYSSITRTGNELHFNLRSDNPSLTFSTQEAYIIKDALKSTPKRWGVGVFAGYGISKNGISPLVGVGVTYNIFRW